MQRPPRRTFLHASMALAAIGLFLAGAGGVALLKQQAPAPSPQPGSTKLLLAPMVSVIEPCVLAPEALPAGLQDLAERCQGPQGSAAALVEFTLKTLQPSAQPSSREVLGYTLPVPLLRLFKQDADGAWRIDDEKVGRLVRTMRDTPRPVILYLFSTHFSAQAPIEAALAADPANMGQTRDGPLGTDDYYDSKVFNWTFATTRNTLTERRAQAMQAVLDATCQLPAQDRAKIRGVTLLGELHHLFPNFQAGMGFDGPYRVTDYSAVSVEGFRRYVQGRFGSIEAFNRAVGGDYATFAEVEPPSRDIRTEPLRRYTEHIDAFAQGSLPISGWAHVEGADPQQPAWIHLYRNGQFAGKTPVRLSRQDVLAAKPEFGDANTGWRWDLDFRQLPAGLHQLDIFLETRPGALANLGRRDVAIMDRQQSTPQRLPQAALPSSTPAGPAVQAHIDTPRDVSSYYYNPLVPLWHAFRAQQVVDYLRYFDAQVARSCLADMPRYTHQIVPFTNPGWDENKFAIQASLQPLGDMRLGVSLYGEPTYGHSYFDWLGQSGHRRYGITEFHPLKAMDGPSLRRVFDAHAKHGADFLSFFAEPRWNGALVPRGHNMFSFDPDNAKFGSDRLYRAVQQALEPAKP
ncbi:hypothetical protein [Paracidovorax valerianellae]|uniref:Beta-galactosidase n=1 Tax=Paracidovorax valerianellae TaxID=187868 RepID=A0A1G7BKD1_9BURK|nr:hypothetical protein [Paracidovorax valerianellae]MDA8445946.1 hypothetical protein [Paracidovorax valerianellae]SDE27544.1 hypothetical protein SAMN05192589_114102 [Paracidovorax valerianellae]